MCLCGQSVAYLISLAHSTVFLFIRKPRPNPWQRASCPPDAPSRAFSPLRCVRGACVGADSPCSSLAERRSGVTYASRHLECLGGLRERGPWKFSNLTKQRSQDKSRCRSETSWLRSPAGSPRTALRPPFNGCRASRSSGRPMMTFPGPTPRHRVCSRSRQRPQSALRVLPCRNHHQLQHPRSHRRLQHPRSHHRLQHPRSQSALPLDQRSLPLLANHRPRPSSTQTSLKRLRRRDPMPKFSRGLNGPKR